MSSTIKIVPNAAAIAWNSLVNAIDARALMEGAMFSIFADDMKTSIKETGLQASSAKSAGENEAWQQGVSGFFSILGAVVGLGYDQVQTAKANQALQDAQAAPYNETQIEVDELNSSSSSCSDIELDDLGEAEIDVQNNASSKDAKADSLTKAQKDNIKQARENARAAAQRGQVLSPMINQLVQGAGSFASAHYTNKKAQDQAAQALAQGIGATFNSEVSQVASAINSCDSNMQGANQALQAIINVSAVRG